VAKSGALAVCYQNYFKYLLFFKGIRQGVVNEKRHDLLTTIQVFPTNSIAVTQIVEILSSSEVLGVG
jgi:hypothetical protein